MNGTSAIAVYSHHRRGLLRRSRYGTHITSAPTMQATRQRLQRVAEPFAERLVRQPVGVLPDELGVVAERQIDDRGDDREQHEVDDDRKEPVAADPPRERSAATQRSRWRAAGPARRSTTPVRRTTARCRCGSTASPARSAHGTRTGGGLVFQSHVRHLPSSVPVGWDGGWRGGDGGGRSPGCTAVETSRAQGERKRDGDESKASGLRAVILSPCGG